MASRLVKIGEAAKLLGTSVVTLRRWDTSGELVPARKSKGGTRYYNAFDLLHTNKHDLPTICYARVSSADQKADLERQQAMLESYCAAKGWRTVIVKDLGSGLNYRKKGINGRLFAASCQSMEGNCEMQSAIFSSTKKRLRKK